ncbi:MAG TPA: potassium transporter Kup [Solirubrobacteraceae bacterium]|jgi:KUP system potassium uptake protein
MSDAPPKSQPTRADGGRTGAVAASREPPTTTDSDTTSGHHTAGAAALTLGALGVVFGDIGTSPLYALQTVFHADHGAVPTTPSAVYGVLSLIFWAVTIIVSLKYVTLIMRADNDGEGGIMALIASLRGAGLRSRRAKVTLIALGIFGAALFYGDGMITPAISVLSAVEGLEVVSPSFESLVVPIALGILTVLFTIQRFGTGAVGRLFGPVMGVWFTVLAIGGVRRIIEHPGILRALSPHYGVQFFVEHGGTAFIALGSVVLAVTGAEALYADMGHFGHSPIRRAWFFMVFPALTLNYLGQGSLILDNPKTIASPFFLSFPEWSRVPMVILATLATVIASQAVISGAFSVTRQAVGLGFLPRLAIRHTSRHEVGQVYVPAVNWGIFAAVVALVVGFGSSTALASAYGIAVTGTLAIDTLLFFVVVRVLWKKSLRLAIAGAVGFLVVDLAFFAANLTKVLHGGWFPLLIALLVFVVLMTWQKGREILTRNRTEEEGPLRDFVETVHAMQPPVYRSPGTGVFLNATKETTPLAMRASVEHYNTLPSNVVIISIETLNVPNVPEADQVSVDDLGYRDDGISHVSARVGFQDRVEVPHLLDLAVGQGLEGDCNTSSASYFVSRMTIVPTDDAGMSRWRKKLFLTLARNTSNPVAYFGLPDDRTVVMGSHVNF